MSADTHPWEIAKAIFQLLLTLLQSPWMLLGVLMRRWALWRRLPWPKIALFVGRSGNYVHRHEAEYLRELTLMYLREGRIEEARRASRARFSARVHQVVVRFHQWRKVRSQKLPSARHARPEEIRVHKWGKAYAESQLRGAKEEFITASVALGILEWSEAEGDAPFRALLAEGPSIFVDVRELDEEVARMVRMPQETLLQLQREALDEYRALKRALEQEPLPRDATRPKTASPATSRSS